MINQRVIFLNNQDEVSEAISYLKKTKKDNVVFVIPQKATFFQSIINIKILRNKSEELNKTIYIVTKNKKGQKMSENAGVPTFETLEELETALLGKVPIKANSNKKKSSINQKTFRVDEIIEKEKKEDEEAEKINWREIFSRPSKAMLITLSVITLALFFFVSMWTLPGATIYIKPERKTIPTVVNVTLAPQESIDSISFNKKRHIISGYKIEASFNKEIDFKTITKVFTGKHTEGQIVIINAYQEPRSLKPKTRFQSDKGVVYRISEWATVPGASAEGNGEVVVTVKADERDIYGDIVGESGNILEPERLIIPGLPPAGQEIMWAEVREPLGGGVTSWEPKVTEEDFEMAKKYIQEKIEEETQANLEKFIREKNALEGTNLVLVPESKFVNKKITDISVEKEKLNTDTESFKAYAEIEVDSWAYDASDLVSILRDELSDNVDDGMYLEKIDPSSVIINPFDVPEETKGLKINVNAKGIEAYLIEPENPDGIRFVNSVKEAIKGKKIDEAENILVNFAEISDVKIAPWPFFLTKVPMLEDKILIKLWTE